MLFCDFHSKLKKLQRRLFVDCNNEVTPYHNDFPHAGLYIRDGSTNGFSFVMGVPHRYVPEYTIEGIDTERLENYDFYSVAKGKYFDEDYINTIKQNTPQAVENKILAKGYRAILAHLVSKGFINKKQAERLFGIEIQENRKQFPKKYLAL